MMLVPSFKGMSRRHPLFHASPMSMDLDEISEEIRAFEAHIQALDLTSLKISQRAAIAAELVTLYDKRRAIVQGQKNVWIAASRTSFVCGDRQPCTICKKYESLTQAHHSFPLFMQFDRGIPEPIHDHDWLCPTHHAAIHVMIDALVANRMPDLRGVPPDERDALARLSVKFVNHWKANEANEKARQRKRPA